MKNASDRKHIKKHVRNIVALKNLSLKKNILNSAILHKAFYLILAQHQSKWHKPNSNQNADKIWNIRKSKSLRLNICWIDWSHSRVKEPETCIVKPSFNFLPMSSNLKKRFLRFIGILHLWYYRQQLLLNNYYY